MSMNKITIIINIIKIALLILIGIILCKIFYVYKITNYKVWLIYDKVEHINTRLEDWFYIVNE